jgi:predicted transcriptional regulator
MTTNLDKNCRELFEIIMDLAREIRCCSRDEAICQNLTFHQFIILDAVTKKGELGLADLHQMLSVEKSTTTRLINPLIQKGLLKRKVWECLGGFFDGIAQNIPEGQREEVLESVKVFTRAMRKAAASCRCCG